MSEEIGEIYKKLYSDYNADILDDVKDQIIKNMFKKVSSKFKDSGKGNVVVLNIIYNYFNGALPSSNYVSGPNTLSYQTSDKYNMKMYIFGETHGKKNNCNDLEQSKSFNMDISEYLQQVFSNSDKFIDFYLEDELFRDITLDRNENFIHMLRHDLHDCLNPLKRSECIFKTIRAHFVDARYIYKKSFLYSTHRFGDFVTDVEDQESEIQGGMFISMDEPKKLDVVYKDIIEELMSLKNYKCLSEYVINMAFNVPVIKKELDRCRLDKKLVFYIFEEILTEWYPTKFELSVLSYLLKNKMFNRILGSFLVTIEAPLIDIYTVARMFKKFRKTGDMPSKSKYIIHYAGDDHSNIIRKFLEKLDFKEHFYRRSDLKTSTRCLDMSGIQLDFK